MPDNAAPYVRYAIADNNYIWYNINMVEALQKYSLFGGMMKEQIEVILPFMQEEKYAADDIIIAQGSPNEKIHFIMEGQVSVTRNDVYLSNLTEGDTFGEMEVLDVMTAIASIRSVSPVKAMTISNKSLREIYKLDIKIFSLIIMNLARDISRRIRRMDEKLASSASGLLI